MPRGLTIRARITKQEYAHQGLADGKEASFQIRQYRVLTGETAALPPEREFRYQPPPVLGANS